MARKKIEIFIEITNEREFEIVLREKCNQLICAEVYNHFSESCTALDRLFTKIKLDWSDGKLILLKVPADDIEALKRFRDQSEPVYLFILNGKVTNMFRGVDAVRIAAIAKTELHYLKMEESGSAIVRTTYDLETPTPEEMVNDKFVSFAHDSRKEWIDSRNAELHQEVSKRVARKVARQAARKWHRAELMVAHLRHLNFVLFWPHATHAHPELYERWDVNNIIMIGRESVLLTKEQAEDILYAGDAPTNEASVHKLLSGPALAICFRLLDTEKHFVSLVRSILYEEMPVVEEDKPIKEQQPRKTAFELFQGLSPTREEVWKMRREENRRRKEEEIEKRTRRLSEMQRLARQAKEEALEVKRMEKERKKLELLRAGNVTALNEMTEVDEDEVDIRIPQTLSEETKEEISEDEDADEYFPPAGLPVPGFYAPPNDIAKVNGLAILFPKLVSEYVTPQPECLPPHVLVMLSISQRQSAIEVMKKYKASIIHMGIFKATSPSDAIFVAYSVLQYDRMKLSIDESEPKLTFMVSVEVDIPLLALMAFNPLHVSRDTEYGDEECAAVFPVDYADTYPEFEDFGDMRVLK